MRLLVTTVLSLLIAGTLSSTPAQAHVQARAEEQAAEQRGATTIVTLKKAKITGCVGGSGMLTSIQFKLVNGNAKKSARGVIAIDGQRYAGDLVSPKSSNTIVALIGTGGRFRATVKVSGGGSKTAGGTIRALRRC